jgi:phosphoadenosine phosphosulfate reductase
MLLEPADRFRPGVPTAFAIDALNRVHEGAAAEDVLVSALLMFPRQLAMVSSFGAESAVLLHLLSRIDRTLPVLMVDTEMLFQETLEYQSGLSALLGLTDVRRITPDAAEVAREDRFGVLHRSDTDRCCDLRKIRPLERALDGFTGWISGRKRHQTGNRAAMRVFEIDPNGRLKINPLADWDRDRIRAYAAEHALPPHPLVSKGFLSIGCLPCTTPVAEGEDERAGRWRGTAKEECGIHFGPDGAVRRSAA